MFGPTISNGERSSRWLRTKMENNLVEAWKSCLCLVSGKVLGQKDKNIKENNFIIFCFTMKKQKKKSQICLKLLKKLYFKII